MYTLLYKAAFHSECSYSEIRYKQLQIMTDRHAHAHTYIYTYNAIGEI